MTEKYIDLITFKWSLNYIMITFKRIFQSYPVKKSRNKKNLCVVSERTELTAGQVGSIYWASSASGWSFRVHTPPLQSHLPFTNY